MDLERLRGPSSGTCAVANLRPRGHSKRLCQDSPIRDSRKTYGTLWGNTVLTVTAFFFLVISASVATSVDCMLSAVGEIAAKVN